MPCCGGQQWSVRMVLTSPQLAKGMSVPKPSQGIASHILEESPDPGIGDILYLLNAK